MGDALQEMYNLLLDAQPLNDERRRARERIVAIWRVETGQSETDGLVATDREWRFFEALLMAQPKEPTP